MAAITSFSPTSSCNLRSVTSSSSSIVPSSVSNESSTTPCAAALTRLCAHAACGIKAPQLSCTYGQSSWIKKEFGLSKKSCGSNRKLSNANGKIIMNLDFPGDSESNGYFPGAEFYKVEAIVRPWRLPHVASALLKSGIRGVTVSDVRGFGAQGGSRERQAGSEFTEDNFVTKVKLEIVVSKDQVEVVIETIIDQARTGEIGDGKIFVVPVADVIRIRTGERGLKAERMAGGRSELLSIMN